MWLLTESPLGYERWCIKRNSPGSFLGTDKKEATLESCQKVENQKDPQHAQLLFLFEFFVEQYLYFLVQISSFWNRMTEWDPHSAKRTQI